MTRAYGRVFGIVVVGVLLLALRSPAQDQGEGENEADKVTPAELQLYTDVYTAMQANHDLTLDSILAQKGVSLEQFRNIERRVQKQDRLVRKVREALQAQARSRADALGAPAQAAAPPPTHAPAPK